MALPATGRAASNDEHTRLVARAGSPARLGALIGRLRSHGRKASSPLFPAAAAPLLLFLRRRLGQESGDFWGLALREGCAFEDCVRPAALAGCQLFAGARRAGERRHVKSCGLLEGGVLEVRCTGEFCVLEGGWAVGG